MVDSGLEASEDWELDMFLTIDDMGRVTHGSIGLGTIYVREAGAD
ncbi:MAG: hypothetical protein ACXW32_08720 [Limisphaerales bacterium]